MAHWFSKIDRQDRRTAVAALAVFVLLAGLYSLTYSGIFKSGDEQWYVGGAVSLSAWGDLSGTPTGLKVFNGGYGEPLEAVVGAGLYQAARLAKVGVVQTLFLTNVYVVALTGVVVFLIVRRRGSGLGVATAAALVFGLATLAWPHTTYYFKDPLAMFFVAAAFLSFELTFARTSWLRRGLQWLLTLCLLGAGVFAKNTAVFAAPALLFAALVHPDTRKYERRIILAGLAAVAILGILALFVWNGLLGAVEHKRSPVCAGGATNCVVGTSFVPGIVGLLVSPGKGFFTESPALLLALVALPLANRRERVSQLAMWLMLLGMVVGIAYYEDYLWYGGTGWGVRHLLPVIPLAAAACAPALSALATSRRLWPKLAGGGLILVSVIIQIGAVSLGPDAYYGWLWQIKQSAWGGAIWNPLYAEAVGYWRLLFAGGALDLTWVRTFPYHRVAVAGLLGAWFAVIAGALFILRSALKGGPTAKVAWASAGLAVLSLTIMPYGLLRAYYPDPYYSAEREDYRAAAEFVVRAAQPGDALVVRGLGDPIWKYLLNTMYSPVPWYVYAPYAPNDTPSDSALDEAASTPWLKPDTERVFSTILPPRYDRLWHLSDECTAWADLRLEERWLAKRYTAVSSRQFQAKCSTRVSLFALATAPAGQPSALDFSFGDAIRLTSAVRLARANQGALQPGQVLPLRLDWRLTQPVSVDYTIGVYLLDAGGALKTQQDGSARGGFYPMTHWPVSAPVPDQHGIQLPPDLATGEYQVAVAVYNWQTGDRLPVRDANGPVRDNLAPLFTVQVSAP